MRTLGRQEIRRRGAPGAAGHLLLPWIVAALVVVVAAGTGVAILMTREPKQARVRPTSSLPAIASAAPSEAPSPVATASALTAVFPQAVDSGRLKLYVFPLKPGRLRRIAPCELHAFGSDGAYAAGCRLTPDLILFDVAVQNTSSETVSFARRRFELIDRDGDRYHAVNVHRLFDSKRYLLPSHGSLKPQAYRSGWLAFPQRRSTGVARSLGYRTKDGPISVAFRGRHRATSVR